MNAARSPTDTEARRGLSACADIVSCERALRVYVGGWDKHDPLHQRRAGRSDVEPELGNVAEIPLGQS